MALSDLFAQLADILSPELAIERRAKEVLLSADGDVALPASNAPLPAPILAVMQEPGALPVCAEIARLPFSWAPPRTSSDPEYVRVSAAKAHVELLGPGGLVKSDAIRLGLYGMLPNAEYGMRRHPAEEVYVMLAGTCDWARGTEAYEALGPGERSFHPTMMPHANRSGPRGFMSIYIWQGDLSDSDYVYEGQHSSSAG